MNKSQAMKNIRETCEISKCLKCGVILNINEIKNKFCSRCDPAPDLDLDRDYYLGSKNSNSANIIKEGERREG